MNTNNIHYKCLDIIHELKKYIIYILHWMNNTKPEVIDTDFNEMSVSLPNYIYKSIYQYIGTLQEEIAYSLKKLRPVNTELIDKDYMINNLKYSEYLSINPKIEEERGLRALIHFILFKNHFKEVLESNSLEEYRKEYINPSLFEVLKLKGKKKFYYNI